MSEQNQEVVRRLLQDVWSDGNIAALPSLVAQDFTCRAAGDAPLVTGLEEYRKFVAAYLALYGHIKISVREQISDGNTVATRWAANFLDDDDGEVIGMSFHKLGDGKITEAWDTWDTFRAAEAVEGAHALDKLIPISG